MLRDKNILLGVTGSIAAYKTAVLTRLLVKAGANVKIIMTPASTGFISKLTLATLSQNPVYTSFEKNEEGEWNSHVDLGLWADLMVIAPATANTLAKMSNGLCDNLLLAAYLSARCKVAVAPAMDLDMFQHPSTKRSLDCIRKDGVIIIDAEEGDLASGLIGKGRMAEPEHIFEFINTYFTKSDRLKGKKAIVTAGPTVEAIDPVRFISNYSSGKMGYAIAQSLLDEGCEVTLVSGPSNLAPPAGVHFIKVNSAEEMYEACLKSFDTTHISVMSAAVADYKPASVADHKIKKAGLDTTLQLTKTRDIAASLGALKRPDQIMVGFALETENEIENAVRKSQSKNFDLIVLNSLNDEGAGFGFDTNRITIIDRNNNLSKFELKDKKEVASDIVNEITKLI